MNARVKLQALAERAEKPAALAVLIGIHLVCYCVALAASTHFNVPGGFFAPAFHIFYDPSRLAYAVAATAAFSLVGLFFVFGRFSFGYFIGFYLYTMVFGFLWLNCFSDLTYDHWLAGFSAAASAIAFLIPAVLIAAPVRRPYELSTDAFGQLLTFLLVQGVMTVAAGAVYNFRIAAIGDIYTYREGLEFPAVLGYLIGWNSSCLLPFVFACFLERRNFWRAGAVLVLTLLLYPVTLSKLTVFAMAWLIYLSVLARFFGARTAAVLSLFLPLLAGSLALFLDASPFFFYTADFRMMIIPSNAMDIYSHYFAHHDLTHFCQIRILRPIIDCPYDELLSIVMRREYQLGNLNASLLATEGIASVGQLWAPVPAFLGGLVVAFGNRVSAGLPPRFILVSAAILPQVFLNVPMTITMVTHGVAVLFLLWWITPRAMFRENGPALDVSMQRTRAAAVK